MAVTFPGVYDLIYEMSSISDPLNKWRNTFTVESPNPFDASNAVNDAFGTLLQTMTQSGDQVDKVTAYNWARGRQPYPNGLPIYTKLYGLAGSAPANWYPPLVAIYEPTGQEVCARIDHVPDVGGKPGRTFKRRFYGMPDVAGTDAGPWATIALLSAYQTKLDSIVTSSGVHNYLTAGSSPIRLVVVRWSHKTGAPPPSASVISSLQFVGVTTNRQTRKNKR